MIDRNRNWKGRLGSDCEESFVVEIRLYVIGIGEPLKVFKQRANMNRFVFLE